MDVLDANDTSGDVQNFVGVHPSHPDDDEKLSKFSSMFKALLAREVDSLTSLTGNSDYKDSMLREFSHFHPNVTLIIQ